MKLKNLRLIPAMITGLFSVAVPSTASAALTVVNGNFENTAGLTALGGDWYGGVPTDWNGLDNNYTVGGVGTGAPSLRANLEWLSSGDPFAPFYQDIGTLDEESSISLTFDFSRWGATGNLGAVIWDQGSNAVLAGDGNITTPGTITYTASNVPAGTSIRIGFWRANGEGAPAIDNVSISTTPVPEPSSLAMAGLGIAALLMSRRRHV